MGMRTLNSFEFCATYGCLLSSLQRFNVSSEKLRHRETKTLLSDRIINISTRSQLNSNSKHTSLYNIETKSNYSAFVPLISLACLASSSAFFICSSANASIFLNCQLQVALYKNCLKSNRLSSGLYASA